MKPDKEDSELLARAAVIATGFAVAILGLAGMLGLAWRFFEFAAG